LSQRLYGSKVFNESPVRRLDEAVGDISDDKGEDLEKEENEDVDDSTTPIDNGSEAVQVVNMTVFPVCGVIILMIIGLLVYFFVMRNKTLKIYRRAVKKSPDHQMLSLVTIDKSTPDKILPYPAAAVISADNKNISDD